MRLFSAYRKTLGVFPVFKTKILRQTRIANLHETKPARHCIGRDVQQSPAQPIASGLTLSALRSAHHLVASSSASQRIKDHLTSRIRQSSDSSCDSHDHPEPGFPRMQTGFHHRDVRDVRRRAFHVMHQNALNINADELSSRSIIDRPSWSVSFPGRASCPRSWSNSVPLLAWHRLPYRASSRELYQRTAVTPLQAKRPIRGFRRDLGSTASNSAKDDTLSGLRPGIRQESRIGEAKLLH